MAHITAATERGTVGRGRVGAVEEWDGETSSRARRRERALRPRRPCIRPRGSRSARSGSSSRPSPRFSCSRWAPRPGCARRSSTRCSRPRPPCASRGSITVDTGTYWSVTGQAIIIVAIAVGGLGIMTLASVLGLAVSRRLGLTQRILAAGESRASGLGEVRSMLRTIVVISAIVEVGIAGVLFPRLLHHGFSMQARGVAFDLLRHLLVQQRGLRSDGQRARPVRERRVGARADRPRRLHRRARLPRLPQPRPPLAPPARVVAAHQADAPHGSRTHGHLDDRCSRSSSGTTPRRSASTAREPDSPRSSSSGSTRRSGGFAAVQHSGMHEHTWLSRTC